MRFNRLAFLLVVLLVIPAHAFATSTARKHIYLLATGGTIAGKAGSPTQITGYQASVLPAESLVEMVPAIGQLARISAEQFSQMDSENMRPENRLALAKRVNALLARNDVDGVVITHGTDSLEESAYFLDLTVKSDKPVVLVGSMRPSTALSADGPLNLYNAVLTAVDNRSIGKGVLVVMDDLIISARDVQKRNASRDDAFQGGEYGPLGTITGGEIVYRHEPIKKHTTHTVFDPSRWNHMPKVAILEAYPDFDGRLLRQALADGAEGVVVATTGSGSVPTVFFDAMAKQGLNRADSPPVVRASRVFSGTITRNGGANDDRFNTIPGYDLDPQKARILLMLALAQKMNRKEIVRAFQEY